MERLTILVQPAAELMAIDVCGYAIIEYRDYFFLRNIAVIPQGGGTVVDATESGVVVFKQFRCLGPAGVLKGEIQITPCREF